MAILLYGTISDDTDSYWVTDEMLVINFLWLRWYGQYIIELHGVMNIHRNIIHLN